MIPEKRTFFFCFLLVCPILLCDPCIHRLTHHHYTHSQGKGGRLHCLEPVPQDNDEQMQHRRLVYTAPIPVGNRISFQQQFSWALATDNGKRMLCP
jgi:hypothetical protein